MSLGQLQWPVPVSTRHQVTEGPSTVAIQCSALLTSKDGQAHKLGPVSLLAPQPSDAPVPFRHADLPMLGSPLRALLLGEGGEVGMYDTNPQRLSDGGDDGQPEENARCGSVPPQCCEDGDDELEC